MKRKQLPVTEELDFHYLLSLMPPLYNIDEFSWLPELFSIIGHEKLILLCKYAGGEVIRIPTIDQLNQSLISLQWFYDVYIAGRKEANDIPLEYVELVSKIVEVYDARNNQADN